MLAANAIAASRAERGLAEHQQSDRHPGQLITGDGQDLRAPTAP